MASPIQPFDQSLPLLSVDPHYNCTLHDCDGLPQLLEELLNDCFQHSIERDSLPTKRLACVEKFHRYVEELHCQENLSFIIEICRYRYFFEKLFPDHEKLHAVKPLSSSYVNQSLDRLILELPVPTARQLHPKSVSRAQSRTSSSFSSGVPPFDLELEDALCDKQNAWELLSDQYVRDSDSESEVDLDELDDGGLVTRQWRYILDNFIYDKSPSQVNLTNQTFRSIVEYAALKEEINSPLILMDAYCEVVELIHENVYDTFLTKLKSWSIESRDLLSSAKSSKSAENVCSQGYTGSAPSSVSSTMFCPEKERHCNKLNIHVVAPVPSKRKSKFLLTFSASSSSDVSPAPSTLGHWLGHLKPHSSSRSAQSAPQSPLSYPHASTETSPTFKVNDEIMIPRSRSTMPEEGHSSIINKLWKKKK